MNKIEPALSAEEWEEVFANQYSPMPLNVDEEYDLTERPHPSAAISLYGQPFGFTREDVEALRTAARNFDFANRHGDNAGYGDDDAMNSIADRIEALLPPDSMSPKP